MANGAGANTPQPALPDWSEAFDQPVADSFEQFVGRLGKTMADAGKKFERPGLLRALVEPLGAFVRQNRVSGAVQQQQRTRRELGDYVRAE